MQISGAPTELDAFAALRLLGRLFFQGRPSGYNLKSHEIARLAGLMGEVMNVLTGVDKRQDALRTTTSALAGYVGELDKLYPRDGDNWTPLHVVWDLLPGFGAFESSQES